MTAATLGLDTAGLHRLVVADDGRSAELLYAGGDRASAAHDALLGALRLATPEGELRLDPATARVGLPAAGRLEVLAALEDGTRLPLGTLEGDGATSLHQLCPFELRYASDHGRLHPVPAHARGVELPWAPETDLHTHFAGCPSGEALVRIGATRGVRFSPALLAEAGVRVDAAAPVALAELADGPRARLARALAVPADRRVTFLDMERIYRLRGPITKSPEAFVDLLEETARGYAESGVRYVELSLGSLVEARVLRAIHAHVPRIEDETGVTMRFLLALSRHDDAEWDLDLLRRVRTLAGSVYVAGIDVMGHETNATRAFAPVLRAFGAWATEARPGFVVRVHAGESPAHPENVRVAVEELAPHDVTIRIGHGLYGVDDATLEAIVRRGAVVELNLDSNVALNHLQSARDLPLRRYVEAGVKVVLGTDGPGIYGASAASSARAALLAGLRPQDLRGALRATDEEARALAKLRDARAIGARRTFAVPDDLPPLHYTPEVAARRREEAEAQRRALVARFSEVGLEVLPNDAESLAARFPGRRFVAVSGAWMHSWVAMTDDERACVSHVVDELLEGLDPTTTALLSGGTRHGLEGLLGPRALARGFPVLGAFVGETAPEAIAEGHATHALVVAANLYEKGAGLLELTLALGGRALFLGGGQIVHDEMLAAKNLGVPYLALVGVGASGAHARERPRVAFTRGTEAAWFVREGGGPRAPAPHWYAGANPTVDAVVVRELSPGRRDLLLVRRDPDAPAFPGAWALPGGFVTTRAPRGAAWGPAEESHAEACARELREEAGLALDPAALVRLGVYEGGGRDPRDGPRSWSQTTVFGVVLRGEAARAQVAGGDDADDARWFPVTPEPSLPAELAFDHARIVSDALAILGGPTDPG